MTNNRALLVAGCHLMLLAVLALGLALEAPTARAQSEPDKPAAPSEPSAAAAKPGSVAEVTVTAPQTKPIGIPPEKAAALAAEAAKNEAWRKYRESTPPLTRDPNDQSKDFPGLQSYVPH